MRPTPAAEYEVVSVSKVVRIVQGLPQQTAAQRVRGWLVCGDALPWVRPKRHDWLEERGPGSVSGAPVLSCRRCTRQIGF